MKKKAERGGGNKASVTAKRKPSGAAQQARLKADYKAFRSLEAQREVVERARRAVFHHLMRVVLGNIDLAAEGNEAALKSVLKFAGIDDLPPLTAHEAQNARFAGRPLNEAAPGQVEQAPVPAKPRALRDPVEAFGKKVGMEMGNCCQ